MFVGIGMGVTAGRGGDDAGLSGADGLNFQRDRYRLNGVAYASLMAVPGVTYTRTGSATAWRADGTLVEFAPDVPRITDRGVLVEGQRTNLLVNSAWTGGASLAGWVASGTSTDAGSTTSAAVRARLFEPSGARHYVVQFVTLAPNTTYCMSVSVEDISAGLPANQVLSNGFAVAGITLTFPVCEANPSGGATGIVRKGRLWVLLNVGPTGGEEQIRVGLGVTANATGSARLSLPQVEQASDASSPIITTGAPATRGFDNLYVGGLQQLFASPYSVVAECEELPPSGARSLFAMSQGGLTNRVTLYCTGSDYALLVVAGGATLLQKISTGALISGPVKAALSFDGQNYRAAVNGVLSGGTVTTPFTAPLERLYPFGSAYNGGLPAVPGRRLSVLPYALTDAELMEMTQ